MVFSLRIASTRSQADSASLSLPADLQRGLFARGEVLEAIPGESSDVHRERIDSALMAMFRDTREEAAFEALYLRARGRVFDWVRRLLAQQGCGLDPLEVLQDTFVNVYQYSARFRNERPESFRVWVRTIASNALRRLRSQIPRRREQALLFEAAGEPLAVRCEPNRAIEEREESRELAVSWLLFLQHYQHAFSQLAARDREALELVEVHGLSYAEAGARLGVGPSNMKMIMFRARQRLVMRMQRSLDCLKPQQPQARRLLSAVG